MELLLNYALNQNNGLSPIENIESISGTGWGVPSICTQRIVVPMQVTNGTWYVFSYVFNSDVSKWLFHQLLNTTIITNGSYIRTAITPDHLFVNNNVDRKCYVYGLDIDQQWSLTQTIDILTTPREIGTAQSGTLISIQLDTTSLGTVDGYYVGWTCRITGGTGVVDEERVIINYTAANWTADVDLAWTVAPDNTTTYALYFNSLSERISAFDEYLAISDWAYLNASTFGAVIMYKFNTLTLQYDQISVIESPTPGDNKFGYAIALRNGYLVVGAYGKSNAFANDGSVYVYEYSAGTYPLTPTDELVSPIPDVDAYFGISVDAYTETGQERILVGATGYDISKGAAFFFMKQAGVWELETQFTPPVSPGDSYGSWVSIWNDRACVSALYMNLGQGEVYIYEEEDSGLLPPSLPKTWVLKTSQTSTGVTGYGVFNCIYQDSLITCVMSADTLVSYRDSLSGSWAAGIVLIYLTQTKLVINYDHSIYHSTDNNTILNLKLTNPISGNFLMTLSLKNAIKTIGNQNNVIYFYEDGVGFKQALVPDGSYDGYDLATVATAAMNEIGTLTYTVTWNNTIQKFSVQSSGLFCFGSNSDASYVNSCQDKVMGFFNSSYVPLGTYVLADSLAALSAPTQLGVKVKQGFPLVPVQNNNPFAEIGFVANLVSGYYVITNSDNQTLRLPNKVSELTLTFPCVQGGGLTSVNTNELSMTLLKGA